MPETPKSDQDLDTEIKQVQLAIAQVELASKQKDLADKTSWRALLRNPVVLVAIGSALAGGIFGQITSCNQTKSDRRKAQSEINSAVLTDALHLDPRNPDFGVSARKIKLFLDAGVITDDNGALRRFVKSYLGGQ
jgi:hypothetical protein